MSDLNFLHFTGTQINYYFICQRKLWYFSNHITMETSSDTVLIGKTLHQDAYPRKFKEFMIDNTIVIDFIEKEGTINEIKKSNKMEQSHIYQMLYYLYYLKNKGLKYLKGTINYPLLKEKVTVNLTKEKETDMSQILKSINNITQQKLPPRLIKKLPYCKSCAYYELCWI